MKPLSYSRSLALTLLLGSLGMIGCGGSMSFPDAVSNQQVLQRPVHGTIYGGHAPITGSHIYLAQPGTSGYGSPATSLLTTAAGSVTANTSDPGVPTGAMYLTTDSSGAFYINSYSCTPNQPVFIYSYGGQSSTTQGYGTGSGASHGTYTYDASGTLIISNATQGPNGTADYTFTTAPASGFTVGEQVTIGDTAPVNGTQTVLAATNTTFTIKGSNYVPRAGTDGYPNNYGNGTYTNPGGTVTGYGLTPAGASSPISALATLGVCPSAGNFNGVISYVYMNEVSTVATAYTFQPFTLATNNNAWDIGTSGTTQAITGINNAALTAAQLYDIQGASLISSTNDGEGHIANYQTQLNGVANQGNGVVPQATIDTLANILAACIDSTAGTGGALAAQCSTLFNTATDGGSTVASGDTAAIDTATAAINIARYPAGNHSGTPTANYAKTLFGIPTGAVPYAPNLNVAPNDWTIAINYPETAVSGYGSATNSSLGSAESIAVDNIGQIWITAQSNTDIVRWSPLGEQNVYKSFGYIAGYVSIDGSNNAWTGNASSTSPIYEAGSNGVFSANYGSGYNAAYTVITNKGGDAFFFANTANTGGNYQMFEYGPGGATIGGSPFSISPSVISAGDNIGHGAIDSAGDLWITSESSDQIARVSPTGAAAFTPIKTAQQPEFPAIDAAGNAWVAVQETNSEIYVVSPTGGQTILTSGNTGAELTSTFGAAVDGNGNVWFANRAGNYGTVSGAKGTNSLIEIDGATRKAISPATNYVPEAQYGANASNTTLTPILDGSLNLAIDPSGNIWITNYTGSSVTEVVGAAAPVVTPLSLAAGNNLLGQKPH